MLFSLEIPVGLYGKVIRKGAFIVLGLLTLTSTAAPTDARALGSPEGGTTAAIVTFCCVRLAPDGEVTVPAGVERVPPGSSMPDPPAGGVKHEIKTFVTFADVTVPAPFP